MQKNVVCGMHQHISGCRIDITRFCAFLRVRRFFLVNVKRVFSCTLSPPSLQATETIKERINHKSSNNVRVSV